MYSNDALMILTFLLPGFLAMSLLATLTPSPKKGSLQQMVTALIFTLVIYSLHGLFSSEIPFHLIKKTTNQVVDYSFAFRPGSTWLLILITVCVPLIISGSIKWDVHMKFFRLLKITDQTSRDNVWFDVFTDKKGWIIVNFEDGRRLLGWPEYYSDNPSDPTLFLSSAEWLVNDTESIALNNEGILITNNYEIESIEFLREEE